MVYASPAIAIGEVARRMMWSWFRLENEQLHNTEGYRRVDFVPLHFDTEESAAAAAARRKVAAARSASRVQYEVVGLIGVVIVLTVISVVTGS